MASEGETSELRRSTDYTTYGITDIPKQTTTTAWGKTKTFAGFYLKDWLFLGLSFINIMTAVALTIYRLVVVVKDDPKSADFTFTILILVNAAFCSFYVLHGMLRERVYELYVFIIAVLVILVYCIVEYSVNDTRRGPVKLARLIVACVVAPPNIFLAWSVARDFGYLEFRIVGASEYLQHLYHQAAMYSCLLKFDLQVTVSLVVLALEEGTKLSTLEQVTLGIGIPYSLIWDIMGWVALRREIKALAWTFAVLGLAKPAYYIFKFVKVYQDFDMLQKNDDDTLVYSLLAAGALALLVWIVLMYELYYIYKNFGKGLKERAYDVIASENTSLLTGRSTR